MPIAPKRLRIEIPAVRHIGRRLLKLLAALDDIVKHRELGFLVVLKIGGLDVFRLVRDIRAEQAHRLAERERRDGSRRGDRRARHPGCYEIPVYER